MSDFFAAAGPLFVRGVDCGPAHIVCLAPTLLHALGVESPADWDGRVLFAALSAAGR